MTDNRTTELLRKLLRERGIECTTDDDERAYDEPAKTTWDYVLCGLEMTVTATDFVDIEGKTYLEMDFHHAFTPEQAIAATLGSDPSVEWSRVITGLIAAHYDNDEERFKERAVQAAKMYDKAGKCEVAEYIIAQYCPAMAFVPM